MANNTVGTDENLEFEKLGILSYEFQRILEFGATDEQRSRMSQDQIETYVTVNRLRRGYNVRKNLIQQIETFAAFCFFPLYQFNKWIEKRKFIRGMKLWQKYIKTKNKIYLDIED